MPPVAPLTSEEDQLLYECTFTEQARPHLVIAGGYRDFLMTINKEQRIKSGASITLPILPTELMKEMV